MSNYVISYTDTTDTTAGYLSSFTVRPYTSNGPSNPTTAAPLPATATSANTSIEILGKGFFDYGQEVAESFVNMLENFANVKSPVYAIRGQQWYKNRADVTSAFPTDSGQLFIRRNLSAMQLGQNPTTDVPVWDQVVVAGNPNAVVRGSIPFGGTAGVTITGLPLPAASGDAATKSYVDTAVSTAGGSFVPLAGGTMTGLLTLSGNPTVALGAATKQYVDASVIGFVPLAGGTMTGSLVLNGNPTLALGAATKQYVDTAVTGITGFVPIAGFVTMTGPLILNGDPTASFGAATKNYVDTVTLGTAPHKISDVVVTAATTGQLLQFNGTNWVNATYVAPSTPISGSFNSTTSTLTLTTSNTINIPIVVSTSTVAWNADPLITGSALRQGAVQDPMYPNLTITDAISIIDQMLFALRSRSRTVFTGVGINFSSPTPFIVNSNSSEVYIDGIKQICDTRGTYLQPVQQKAYYVTSVVTGAGGKWGVGPGDVSGDFTVGEKIIITNNTSLDASAVPDQTSYTVASATFDGISQTLVTVNETIPPGAIATGKLNHAFVNGTSSAASPTGLSYSTPYSFNATVDGVGPTLVAFSITPPPSPAPAISFVKLISIINTAMIALGLQATAMQQNNAVNTSNGILFVCNTSGGTGTGAGTISLTDVNLFSSLMNATGVTVTPASTVGTSYGYQEQGQPGSPTTSIQLAADLAGGTIEFISLTSLPTTLENLG